MDQFKIRGRTAARRDGAHQRREKCRASGDGRGAADRKSPSHLTNVPARARHHHHGEIARAHERATCERTDMPPTRLTIQARRRFRTPKRPTSLVKTMRASVLTLGPLVARFGYARVSLPGGCAIGARPDRSAHSARSKKWARKFAGSRLRRSARRARLRGADIHLRQDHRDRHGKFLMAATLAEGETVLSNAAREPEVTDLADLLIKMGARIEGAGTATIRMCVASSSCTARAYRDSRPHRGRHFSGCRRDHRREHVLLTDCEPAAPDGGASTSCTECGVEIHGGRHDQPARARPAASYAPPTSPPRNIRDSPPICRRNSWRWRLRPTDVRASPRRFSRIASCTRAK